MGVCLSSGSNGLRGNARGSAFLDTRAAADAENARLWLTEDALEAMREREVMGVVILATAKGKAAGGGREGKGGKRGGQRWAGRCEE